MENTIKIQQDVPVGAQIKAHLAELAKFGKGERASKAAKKIRRNLRALGYYINDPTTHSTLNSKELPVLKKKQEETTSKK